MSKWKEYRFSELLMDESISYGIVQPGTHTETDSVPIIRVNNIKNGYIETNDALKVASAIEEKYRRTRLEGGELLITVVGSVGECAIVPDSLNGWNVARAVSVARIKEGVNKHFIKYCFKTEDIKYQLYGNTNDTVQPTLNLSSLKELKILLPSLPEQTAIAEVLRSLDDKIDLLQRQNKTLEQLAETLFRQWFVEEADESWRETKFGALVVPKKGKNITKSEVIEGQYPVVAGGLEPSCYHNISNTRSPVITVSASGANAGFVRLYHSEVWSSDSSYIDETITPFIYFSYVFLKMNQRQLTDKQEGSAQPHIYPSHIMELDMLEYPNNLIDNFEKEVTPLFLKLKSNTQQIHILTKLRDTLLPKLMSGEIRIN